MPTMHVVAQVRGSEKIFVAQRKYLFFKNKKIFQPKFKGLFLKAKLSQ